MKKIYGFLTAAAILLTAACTQDLEDPKKVDGVKGDFFMTMNITPVGNTATRATTQTPNQGSEVGQDGENSISDALVIFAKLKPASTDQYQVFAVLGGTNASPTISGGNRIDGMTSYSATFKTERSVLLKDVQASSEKVGEEKAVKYKMFVIANPSQAMKTAYNDAAAKYSTAPVDVQSTFAVADAEDNSYWTDANFLMSNAQMSDEVVIKESDVAMGTHTSPAEALSLGSVIVQRAMSRFDIATGTADRNDYWKFTITNEKSPIKSLSIEMQGVALVNMAKSANVFKVTADDYEAINNNGNKKTLAFAKEEYTMAAEGRQESGNWVFTPDQNYDFLYPMFGGLSEGAGASEGTTLTGDAKNLGTEFTYTSWATLRGTNGERDRDTFTPPTDASSVATTYKFWRYCMENTNPDQIANQKNGVSTGVIFKAEIKVVGNESDESSKFGTGNLYALGNVFFGSLEHLRDYVYKAIDEDGKNIHTDDADVYATVSNKFKDAVKAYNESEEGRERPFYEEKKMVKGENGKYTAENAENTTGKEEAIGIWGAEERDLQVLNKYLVNYSADTKGQGFSIYEPDGGKYYCYYIYWNRHNNNYDDTQMGIMEFATVRNNVYKLSVGAVLRLGHPANPDNDPKKPDPDDPDEEDEFYCTIDCKVLDWDVRINDIIF